MPSQTEAELKRAGFRSVEVVGDDYPERSGTLTTDWYYYVFATRSDTEAL